MRKILFGFFTTVGFLVVVIVAGALIFAAHKKEGRNKDMPEHMVLTLAIDDIVDYTANSASLLSALGPPQPTLLEIIQTLDIAGKDPRVSGVAFHLKSNDLGLASVQELRDAIFRFRRNKKFAYIYADTLGDSPSISEYWLATAFDQIWLQPMGELAITGLAAELPFLKDVLDKIGVEAEILHAGKYKSYPETVMRNTISPENKEMTTALLNDIQGQFIQDVGKTRKIAPAAINSLMAQAPLTSTEAEQTHLIDKTGYRDEFDSALEQDSKGAEAVSMDDYIANGPRAALGEKIALVHVAGGLTSVTPEEAIPGEVVSADGITDALQQATDNNKIRAIIVRVDSPGGTPLAADMIRRSIELAKLRKPVIISMDNTAASGGYWMSTSADAIIAQPGTLTGSIGVFGGKMNAQKLWAKLGVNWEEISTNGNGSLWSINEPFSDANRAKVQRSIERTYNEFIQRVATGRHMKPEQVEAIAQGRVWTGSQAIKIGLVDQLGGMDVAVQKARVLAKINPQAHINLIPFPKPLNPIEKIMQLVQEGLPRPLMGAWMRGIITDSFKSVLAPQTELRSPLTAKNISY